MFWLNRKSSVDKPVIVLFNTLSVEHLAATKDAFEVTSCP